MINMPTRKTLEFFFWDCFENFKNLKTVLKKEFLKFGVLNVNKFINFIDTLVFKNNCAHSDVLFDFQNSPLEYPLFQKLIITIGIDIL